MGGKESKHPSRSESPHSTSKGGKSFNCDAEDENVSQDSSTESSREENLPSKTASSSTCSSYHSAAPPRTDSWEEIAPAGGASARFGGTWGVPTLDPAPVGMEPRWVRKYMEERTGRVHSATVSAVNPASRSVTVEWFEKGETKGKEVEFDAVFSLNPDLEPQDRKLMPPPPAYTENEDESSSSGADLSDYIPSVKKKPRPPTRGSGRFLRSSHTNVPAAYRSHNNNNAAVVSSSSNLPRPPGLNQVLRSQSTSRINAMNSRAQNSSSGPTTRNKDNPRPSYVIRPPQNGGAVPTPKLVGGGPAPARSSENISTSTVSKATANPALRGRKSNVVKEVDRIQKNREERRAKQAEKKEEKEALMNIDPGNPNWEFLNMIREFRQQLDFRPLKDGDPLEEHQITVAVRKRPLNKKEFSKKEVDVITIPKKDTLYVHEPKTKVDLTKYVEHQSFRFDYAFDESCQNDLVYKYTARPLVHTIFENGMATCFAYGQTGSGKTHTMGGDFQGRSQDCAKGIYALAAKDVFALLKSPKFRHLNLQVSSSFFEIYGGKVFDLLNNKKKLRVLEDGKQVVQVVGLQERVCQSVEDVLALIMMGSQVRTSGQTTANNQSSRSHAVFQIILRNLDKIERQAERQYKLHGKFSLIDLAGNERGADTSSANRQTRMEGAEINKSLLALKECIRALGKRGAHLPFRASKLTQVLRDSFIGEKSKTCMIAMISPGVSSCEHTLNTLRYADRVKELGLTDGEAKGGYSDKREENGVNDNDYDYSHLASYNEEDMSADQAAFQVALGALQEAEEDVVEYHGQYFTHRDNMDKMLIPLYQMTNEIDYDVDAYTQQLEEVVLENLEWWNQLKARVTKLRHHIVEEEKVHNEHTT